MTSLCCFLRGLSNSSLFSSSLSKKGVDALLYVLSYRSGPLEK